MSQQYSILEILNIKEGTYHSLEDFLRSGDLKKQEDLRLQYSKDDATYVCAICNQTVFLRGGRSKNKLHFAHLPNSDDCPWKAASKLGDDEIDRRKYNGAVESDLHKSLKNEIFEYIASSNNVNGGKLEEVIKSSDLSLWRKPDINFSYGDRRIALEIQISTTWLSVITERAEFYRNEGIYLFWVFSCFEEDDNKRRLAYTDIVFSSMQNAFVFDEDARTQSEQNNKLFLKCFYPIWSYNDITSGLDIEWKNEVISFDDLLFNDETKQIYYHDSQPSYESAKEKQERAKTLKIEVDRIKMEDRNAARINLTETIQHLKELNQIIEKNKNEIKYISTKLSEQEQSQKKLLNAIEVKDKLVDDMYRNMSNYDSPYYDYYETIDYSICQRVYDSYHSQISEIKKKKDELSKSNKLDLRRREDLCALGRMQIGSCVYSIIPEETASKKDMTFNNFNVFYISDAEKNNLFTSSLVMQTTKYMGKSYIHLLDYNERCAELNKRLDQYGIELEETKGKETICKQDIKNLLDEEINSRIGLIDNTVGEYNTQLGELDMTLKRAEYEKTTFERNNSCKNATCKNRQYRCPLETLNEYRNCSYYKPSASVSKP